MVNKNDVMNEDYIADIIWQADSYGIESLTEDQQVILESHEKKLTIWVCEDDESMWEEQKEILKDRFPAASIKFFENAGYAAQSTGSPNYILIDVGGICIGCNITLFCRVNVEGLSELHPGAVFIINSAVEAYAKDVWDELKPECQAMSRWAGYSFEAICDIIKEYEG